MENISLLITLAAAPTFLFPLRPSTLFSAQMRQTRLSLYFAVLIVSSEPISMATLSCFSIIYFFYAQIAIKRERGKMQIA